MKYIQVFNSTKTTVLSSIVMGSNAYRKHLESINKNLLQFEKEPKEIEGNQIKKWFNTGENLFKEFYYLGTSVKWNLGEIKRKTEISDMVSLVTKNQDWLQSFITIYPGLRIDLEGATPAVDVCQVRSGIECLIHGFVDINESFDKVLKNLEEIGELEEFDEHLRIWKENHRPDFLPGDKHADTPDTHWWWF